jgi:hypothetical protein
MSIEDNKEAYQTMKNSIGSMENRMREVYNKGFKDGLKEGINQAMQKIADSILEEVEADRKTEPTISKMEQVDKPQTDCLTCRYNSDEWDSPKCDGCSKANSHYEPQTDCAWK